MSVKYTAAGFIFLLAVTAGFAAKNQETLEELKARAEQAKPQEQVRLFMEVAQRQMEAANKAYADGNSDLAKTAVEEVAGYAEKAGQAALSTGKDLKRTEIAVRKLARRIAELQRTVDFDDRAPLQAVGSRLDKVDSSLLEHMFRKKK